MLPRTDSDEVLKTPCEPSQVEREIGARLQASRLDRGVSPDEIGGALVPPRSARTILAWESGCSNDLDIITLGQLGLLLSADLDWLLFGTKRKTKDGDTVH